MRLLAFLDGGIPTMGVVVENNLAPSKSAWGAGGTGTVAPAEART